VWEALNSADSLILFEGNQVVDFGCPHLLNDWVCASQTPQQAATNGCKQFNVRPTVLTNALHHFQ